MKNTMNKYILKSFLYIPKKELTAKLKKSLVIKRPKNYFDKGNSLPENIVTYKYINEKFVRVPRYAFGNLKDIKYKIKEINNIYNIDIKFSDKIKLNESQNETVNQALKSIKEDYGSVIVAEPGEGKTLMAIKIITELKLKTIILVHKDYLINQWKKALLDNTDLKEEEIGLLKNGKFKDGKIVIGSIQSLMRKTIPIDINNKFSFKIVDETHRIGAEMFLKSFTRFNTKYSLALSATPHRPDKMEKLYFLFTSYNLIFHNNVRSIKSKYLIVPYTSENEWKSFPAYVPYRNQVLRNLLLDNKRNDLIMRLILHSVINLDRKVILLSEFVDILDKFYFYLNKELGEKYIVAKFYSNHGSMKELNKANIVLATYKKAMEGIDIPHLDTLIMLTPISSKVSLKQTIGRIQRFQEGKNQPLVIDILDNSYNFTIDLWQSRLNKYEEWGIDKYEKNDYISIIK